MKRNILRCITERTGLTEEMKHKLSGTYRGFVASIHQNSDGSFSLKVSGRPKTDLDPGAVQRFIRGLGDIYGVSSCEYQYYTLIVSLKLAQNQLACLFQSMDWIIDFFTAQQFVSSCEICGTDKGVISLRQVRQLTGFLCDRCYYNATIGIVSRSETEGLSSKAPADFSAMLSNFTPNPMAVPPVPTDTYEVPPDIEVQKPVIPTGNTLLGMAGAVAGALLGILIWSLMMAQGFEPWLVGALIPIFIIKGYELLKGRKNLVSILVLSTLAVLTFLLAALLGYAASMHTAFQELYALSFLDALRASVLSLAKYPDSLQSFLQELSTAAFFFVISLFFCVKNIKEA